jgi:MYXO-CTERM domain-containing protein
VPPGFNVYASASDDKAVTSAKLLVDGAQADMITSGGPYTFTTSSTLAEGLHRLKIEISDGPNVVQTQEITVTVQKGAPPVTPPGFADGPPEVSGGCSTGGDRAGAGGLLALALLGLRRRRR